jgi:nicotinate-nucleotide adenylyltransferase
MRLGIFPGSFNPPHDGHIAIAKKLISLKLIDKVIFVPVSNFYLKRELIEGVHRLEMLNMATKNSEEMFVSNYEIISETQPYTHQTLEHFERKFDQDSISLIIGADNYLELTSWKNYEYLINNYEIIVIKRGEIKSGIDFKNVKFISLGLDFISSKQIRSELRNKIRPKHLNKEVYEYVLEKGLYLD